MQRALETIRGEFPSVTAFEREFISLTFALATGVGKTRLMGAFIAYLHLAHGVNNFLVLAPNLTIYRKLIADFTPNTPKYVFEGVGEFATYPPGIVTGDTYEQQGALLDQLYKVKINIFNISKLNSEVRGGKEPRIKRIQEVLGVSYFNYLAELDDLVLLMDESHRYRASAGVRAINELKPILGLELTATPFVEGPKGAIPFKNVIVDYPLARAMEDGFVKEPAVVTRKDFQPGSMSAEELEELKLEDGVRLHETIKAELATYATNTGKALVKPFVLVIARDTTHAGSLVSKIAAPEFFGGNYAGKVIQVDSSRSGAEEDEMIEKLLTVESPDNPVEIVVHVNMLKEGWDVTNLYTIIPLRAANARILIEQSIGRGLRLPYGKRTGVEAVDGLNIVAHDKFREIIEEANRSDSPIRMRQLILSGEELERGLRTVVSESNVEAGLGIGVRPPTAEPAEGQAPLFIDVRQSEAARVTYQVLRTLQTRPDLAPTTASLRRPEVQAHIVREVAARLYLGQGALEELDEPEFLTEVVAKTTDFVDRQTIPIPRILVVPKGEHQGRFTQFGLQLSQMRFASPQDELYLQYLRTSRSSIVGIGAAIAREPRLEDYVVSGLVDFDDVCYDYAADLLYDLGAQVVTHLQSYLEPNDVEKVLRFHQKEIARFVHAQMLQHYETGHVDLEVKVNKGWTDLLPSANTLSKADVVRDFKETPADKSKISRNLYGGFDRCLYATQKFQSDPERVFSTILERDSIRWFRPVKGQFQIFYKLEHEVNEYQPDFVAESGSAFLMVEVKAKNEMASAEVSAKKNSALEWCRNATAYSVENGGKPWRYCLIAHDQIAANVSLASFEAQSIQ